MMLSPLKGKTRKRKIYAFDVETTGRKNDFLMGSIMHPDRKIYTFYDPEAMLAHIMGLKDKNMRIYATNLGFDIMALTRGSAMEGCVMPMFRGSHMFRANIMSGNRQLIFLDTLNYFPASVETLGAVIGIEKMKKPAYITEKRMPRPDELPYVEEYNHQDTKITFEFMTWLQDEFNNLNVNLQSTIASTSMDGYKRNYMEFPLYQEPEEIQAFLFKAYYGGRCETLARGRMKNLKYYDVNSMYPFVMQNKFPNPNRWRSVPQSGLALINRYEGVTECTATCPPGILPYLPYRSKDKLLFPGGTFRGTWSHFELKKAIELGYELSEFGSCVYYYKTHEPFTKFVDEMYALRQRYKRENNPAELAVKIYMNALYGKWAERPREREEIRHMGEITDEEFDAWSRSGKMQYLGDWIIYRDGQHKRARHVFPIYSIYVTAYARTFLYNIASSCDAVYMDTDSVVCAQELHTSPALGGLKLEYEAMEGLFIRPKMYALKTREKDVIKMKGVPPAKKWTYDNMLGFCRKSYRIEYEKIVKFRECLRRKKTFNEWIETHKEIDLDDEKRAWPGRFDPDVIEKSMPVVMTYEKTDDARRVRDIIPKPLPLGRVRYREEKE